MIKIPQIKPSYALEQINEEELFLVSQSGNVLLSNKIANAVLLEIAQNRLTRDEILSRFSAKGVAPFEVLQILQALEKQGYIDEANDFFKPEQAAYWQSLGFEPRLLAEILQTKAINIEIVGQVNKASIEQACRDSNLAINTSSHLDIVLTDDYNHKELRNLNQAFEKNQKPWLLVKTTGREIWIGPIFIPGQTACWECLHHRLELHSPGNKFYRALKKTTENPVNPHIQHPINVQVGANKVVLEMIKWLYKAENSDLVGHIFSLDIYTMEQQLHKVVKRPQCSCCGTSRAQHPLPITLKKQSSLASKLGGYRSVSHEETFARYKHHISPITGVVSNVRPYHISKTTPLFNYSSGRNLALQSISRFWLNHHLRSGNGGKGKTDIQAKTGALCEAIERYSLMYHGNEYSITASLSELPEGIHPNKCMNYSKAQLRNREATNQVSAKFYELTPIPFDVSQKMAWTPVYSLSTHQFKYLPTCFCYAQYPAADEMRLYSYPDSNGCAAGNTLEEAILQGFLELIERDAAAIWWYNRIRRPAVDLASINNPYLQEVIQYYQTIHRSLYVLDITSDLGIPVFVAVSHSLEKGKERILYAFGAHLDANIAIERAIIELNQLLPIVLDDKYLTNDSAFVQWLDTQTRAQNDYLIPIEDSKKNIQQDYPTLCEANIYESVRFCVENAQKHGLETLVLNLTQPDVGLPVARVIVPGLRHFWRRTAPGRLYNVPVKMGWLEEKLTEEALNPVGIFI